MFSKTKEKEKLILTFDLEIWHESKWMEPFISEDLKKDTLTESVLPLLRILKETNSHATFFTTNAVLDNYPEIIKKIFSEDHEVGSHSTTHIHLDEQQAEVFEGNLQLQKEKIEKLIGKNVSGFRAPHFSLNQKTKWLIPLLTRLGFLYDSSIFPIKTPEYGISKAPTFPYKISSETLLEDKGGSFLEFPQSTVKIFGLQIPVAGGVYFRILPLFIFKFLLNMAIKQGNTPMVYFHPHELCSETPRIKGPILKTFIKYFGTKRSLLKFNKLIKNYTCISVEEYISKVKNV